MKHIGWCLEKIQKRMNDVPKTVISQDDKKRANNALDEVQGYMRTLDELLTNPNLRKNLLNLENSPIDGVKLQAHEVEELLKDLRHALYVLDLYVHELKEIIVNRPAQWGVKADQLVLMIHQKFGSERGELRREFHIALQSEEELRRLVSCEEHLESFLRL